MKMKWFGEPWPSDELRAPACEDDADKVATPVGRRCIHCERRIEDGDQGVIMAAASSERGYEMIVGARRENVCAEHLECFLYDVLGVRPARAAEA